MNKFFIIICCIIGVCFASFFNISVLPTSPVYNLTQEQKNIALYICPVSGALDGISIILKKYIKQIYIVFFYIMIAILSLWLWALYQNLLKDKFVQDAYVLPWNASKIFGILFIIIVIIAKTPNYYRTVYYKNKPYVLCEANDTTAIAVKYTNVVNKY